jgi:hypothetical protein
VTGGPGARLIDEKTGNHIGIMSTGMNTGKTPAFTKKVFSGVCKKEDWPEIGKNWPKVAGGNEYVCYGTSRKGAAVLVQEALGGQLGTSKSAPPTDPSARGSSRSARRITKN